VIWTSGKKVGPGRRNKQKMGKLRFIDLFEWRRIDEEKNDDFGILKM